MGTTTGHRYDPTIVPPRGTGQNKKEFWHPLSDPESGNESEVSQQSEVSSRACSPPQQRDARTPNKGGKSSSSKGTGKEGAKKGWGRAIVPHPPPTALPLPLPPPPAAQHHHSNGSGSHRRCVAISSVDGAAVATGAGSPMRVHSLSAKASGRTRGSGATRGRTREKAEANRPRTSPGRGLPPPRITQCHVPHS